LQDRLPFGGIRELERDPAVEIDLLKRREGRGALCPPRIRQVLLRRVRDGTRPEDEGEPARSDAGRLQRPEEESAALVEHATRSPVCSVAALLGPVERRASRWLAGRRVEVLNHLDSSALVSDYRRRLQIVVHIVVEGGAREVVREAGSLISDVSGL
jgi:hypothetical protein